MPLALGLAVTAIAFAAILFRKALPTHPIAAAGIRLLVAAVLLSPFLWRAHRRRGLSRRLVGAATVGGLMYGVHFGAWVASLQLTSIAASVTLVTATPLLLAVVALSTGKDRPSRRLWGALGLALCGLVIIGGRDLITSSDALVGDALALLGAAAMAGYLLCGRWLGDKMDVLGFSAIATTVGGLALLATAAASGIPFVAASWDAFGYLVLAALVPQLVGHNLLTWSLRHTTPTVVGLSTLGEPVGAALIGWLWLSEAPAPLTALGCAVTLCAVMLAIRSRASAD